MSAQIPRRQFVKLFVLGTAVSAVSGKPLREPMLAGVTPSNIGSLRVKVSDFPALQENFGSVRLGVNPIDDSSEFVLGQFFPVVITRVGDQFYAVDTFCAHAGCVVPPYDESVGGIICPCHGSGYHYDGSLLNGPSNSPLRRFDADFDGVDVLTIKIPSLGYCVTGSLAIGAVTPRFRLEFPTFDNAEYEVRFREHAGGPPMVVPFALSLNGAIDQKSLIGDTTPATVFFDRTTATGFYTVDIKVLDLS